MIPFLARFFPRTVDHPYPSREQKAELAQRTGLSVPQIVHWMSNVRKRRLIPLLR